MGGYASLQCRPLVCVSAGKVPAVAAIAETGGFISREIDGKLPGMYMEAIGKEKAERAQGILVRPNTKARAASVSSY